MLPANCSVFRCLIGYFVRRFNPCSSRIYRDFFSRRLHLSLTHASGQGPTGVESGNPHHHENQDNPGILRGHLSACVHRFKSCSLALVTSGSCNRTEFPVYLFTASCVSHYVRCWPDLVTAVFTIKSWRDFLNRCQVLFCWPEGSAVWYLAGTRKQYLNALMVPGRPLSLAAAGQYNYCPCAKIMFSGVHGVSHSDTRRSGYVIKTNG
jgi:hypothetical protein